MQPVRVNAPATDPTSEELLAAYAQHLSLTRRGHAQSAVIAARFLRRWRPPQAWAEQPLKRRLAEPVNLHAFLMFLMMHGHLQPGYDYLVERKLSTFWRDAHATLIEQDMRRFTTAGVELGFSPIVMKRVASQSVGRLMIQTGRRLDELALADFAGLTHACIRRQTHSGQGWTHYRSALANAHMILFHLGTLDTPPPGHGPVPFEQRFAAVRPSLRSALVAYLERKTGTCATKTVSGLATRLEHFGRFLTELDPDLVSFTQLDRQAHIEPYLNSLPATTSSKSDQLITKADQARRILAVAGLLTDITEWGWAEAPPRKLIFRSDKPRLPQPLPRYLPVDADRRLTAALERSENRLAADALLLARACGLRIGELLDLELDCVHEVPDNGAWLKVPLGKLDTERMIPLDEETVTLTDRIVAARSNCRALPHPRTGKPAEFLFTHQGRRLGQNALRLELDRACEHAGIPHTTPHQLRHTFATAMVNAGVSLQSLMALLGHVSAEMSLRYGRLFDATVRTEYERALDLAKANIGPLPDQRTRLPLIDDGDWREAPAIKARLAGGYCLRAPAQGACPYANICEHCPSFRTDAASVTVLSAQRLDAQALAEDAQARGWIDEADRHRRLIERLDHLIGKEAAR
jgi:integrase